MNPDPSELEPTGSSRQVESTAHSSQGVAWTAVGRIAAGFGLLMVVLFTVLPNSYGQMVRWPWVAVWQLGFLSFGLWGLLQLRAQQSLRGLGNGLDWVAGLGLLSLVLSALFASYVQPAVWYVVMACGYAAMLYSLNQWFSSSETGAQTGTEIDIGAQTGAGASSQRQRLLELMGGLGILTSLESLILWWPIRETLQDGDALVNPMPLGHHNLTAGYLGLVLAVVLALGVQRRDHWRWAWLSGGGLVGTALIVTGSRGGILGLLALAVAAALVSILSHSGKHRWRVIGFSGLMLVGAIGFALSSPRAQRMVSAPLSGGLDGNIVFRFVTIQTGLRLWQTSPVTGIGPGNTFRLYDLYHPIEAGQTASNVQQMHCTPVHLLAELGLLGFGVYLLWIVLLARLWGRLWARLHQGPIANLERAQRDLWQLYGIGGGLLIYIVSSLTDFQLENIPISSLLVALTVMLASLGRQYLPADSAIGRFIPQPRQRLVNLVVIGGLLVMLLVWLPVTQAMYLGQQAVANFRRNDLQGFYSQWSKAGQLVPWDPYYDFQLAAYLQLLRNGITNDDALKQDLNRIAIQYMGYAVQTAPNDAFFNEYLGRLILDQNPKRAVESLTRAVQLQPLTPLTYYHLGQAELASGQRERAVAAYALESFVNPGVLTAPVWSSSAQAALYPAVLEQSLNLHEQFLAGLPPARNATAPSSGQVAAAATYNPIYQDWVLLRWFNQRPLGEIDLNRLNPTAHALLLLDAGKTAEALRVLEQVPPELELGAKLLRAWSNPKRYGQELAAYPEDNREQVLASLQIRDLRLWLRSIDTRSARGLGDIGYFGYRNTTGMTDVPLPLYFNSCVLVEQLQLFPTSQAFQDFPAYARFVVAAQAELLGIGRPAPV
ncbi:O-antigen ligase family protein [Leptolyngbya sp. FACHB-261]|uniref:O-antigen ligase family protein n=1 Tax=Leptolyngbya sp. FACHB-261 TaxID=2692806 RepID=UPI001689C04A|nr:O-antigen ligase family protein [Leptolyngbya sp. FACHB-261]MBD2103011.1 O-antigen ligase family protein [Leptolyngbya sp. FACHB-261]